MTHRFRLAPKQWLIFALIVAVVCGLAGRFGLNHLMARPPEVPDSVSVLRDVQYAKAGKVKLLADVYRPRHATGPLPVIVWIHGGGWEGGTKLHCPIVDFAALGYAVVSIDYRLAPKHRWPAQIEDCKAAVRWVRASAEKYGFDPKRVAAAGASAGGHLAALLGTSGDVKALEGKRNHLKHSSRMRAVLDLFGPIDLPAAIKQKDSKLLRRLTDQLFHGNKRRLSDAELNRRATQASPTTHITKDDPPFLIIHGSKDPLVPLGQSELLHEQLTKAKLKSKLHVIEDAEHGGKEFATPKIRHMIERFFDEYLKHAPPETQPADAPDAPDESDESDESAETQ
ncbi:MAG: esterase [Planctomycetaceae bacterium]|nr:esterase [Planctomycetaceae bacterium]